MMNPGETAFLVLCEELNFTRAAERCCMTQQGLSNHIRKLEEQYNTKFFLRTPSVQLTESGAVMRQVLLKKEGLENDLVRTIREIDSGVTGEVRFGLNSSRAAFFAPRILKKYCSEYSDVEIRVTTDDTRKLIQLLREEKIDGLLGVNASPASDLVIEPLFREAILVAMPKEAAERIKTVTRSASGSRPDAEESAAIGEISIRELSALDDLIFVRNSEGSTLSKVIDKTLETYGISLNTKTYISDYNVQRSLCKTLGMATFWPGSIAYAVNGPAGKGDLCVFRIKELKERLTISLVTSADRYYPACDRMFFRTVKELLKKA